MCSHVPHDYSEPTGNIFLNNDNRDAVPDVGTEFLNTEENFTFQRINGSLEDAKKNYTRNKNTKYKKKH
jgi:hypothetical protein